MEDGVVVVSVFSVGDEVFNGFGGGFGEEADVDVAVGGVEDGGGAGFDGFGFDGFAGVEVAWFFVLDVARGFADFGFVRVDVEANFARAGRYEHWVAFFGFLEKRVGGCGHGDCDDTLLLRLALVEG